jgi:hypothetical protein
MSPSQALQEKCPIAVEYGNNTQSCNSIRAMKKETNSNSHSMSESQKYKMEQKHK